LNGNNQTQVGERFEHEATPPGSPSTSGYRNMGSIIKGSVMDKVTNVFSGQTMGNSSNKEAASAGASAVAKPSEVGNAINIPKGETLLRNSVTLATVHKCCITSSLLLQFINITSFHNSCIAASLLHNSVTFEFWHEGCIKASVQNREENWRHSCIRASL
jgi:hypothetical protein